ncbi:MAG TPA: hypothetical protein PLK34_02810, partial [Candidatus Pacearchaeota archaeon]|nr:hypothetical protein [Candidatus Pacearchaeota archaeon]
MKLEDIAKVYEQGIRFQLKPRKRKGLKGEYFRGINLYFTEYEDEVDYYKTVLHEFIHVIKPDYKEEQIEDLAGLVLAADMGYLQHIIDLFDLPEWEEIKRLQEKYAEIKSEKTLKSKKNITTTVLYCA